MAAVVSAETVKVHIRQRIEAFSGGYYVEVTAYRRMPYLRFIKFRIARRSAYTYRYSDAKEQMRLLRWEVENDVRWKARESRHK